MRRHLVALLATFFAVLLFIFTMLVFSSDFALLRAERAHSAFQKAVLLAKLVAESNISPNALVSEVKNNMALLGHAVTLTDENGLVIASTTAVLVGKPLDKLKEPIFRDAEMPKWGFQAAYYSAPLIKHHKFVGYVLVKQNFALIGSIIIKKNRLLVVTAFLLYILLIILTDLMIKRIIFKPVSRLQKIVANCGLNDLLSASSHDSHELSALGHTIAQMNIKLKEDRDFQKAQLEKLREAHQELAATKTALTSAERVALAGRLASSIAHDVGNPLGVVQGYLTMLDSLDNAEQRVVIGKMQHELDRITASIHTLLDVSRPITLQLEAVEVAVWLQDLIENLTKMSRLAGVSLYFENSLPQGFTYKLDKERLTAVIENLIINGADAMSENPPEKERRIRVLAAANARELRLNIIDNGPGISAENREKVFEPFFSTKPANRGTGLGLYAAKQVIELHGGKISLTNEIDGGLNVAVLFAT